jgi:prolyl-tRNA editing enzyme YbaK/EbsC (Cys-tRNA(Pro) deacylase)
MTIDITNLINKIMDYNQTTRQIIDRLEDKNIDYEIFEHEPVVSSDEAANVRENFEISQGLKALVLKLYGANQDFAMIVVPGDKSFDQDKVEAALGADDFRFANEEELDKLLGEVKIGGIPPMGSLFDLKTYADESIEDMNEVIFNPGDKEVSIAVSADDYLRIEQPKKDRLI